MSTEKPYENREIREFFNEIKESLKRIEEQTVKTNGRVGVLENWRAYNTGALAVIALLVLPILGWALYQVVTLHK